MDHDETPELSEAELHKLLHRVRGGEQRLRLPTEEEALAYAERVIRATHGDNAFVVQAPYAVEDRGEEWLVRGTNSRLRGVLDPVQIRLRKSDATVLDVVTTGFGGRMAPPDRTRP